MATRNELLTQLIVGDAHLRGTKGNGPAKVTEAMSKVLKPSKAELEKRIRGCTKACENVTLFEFKKAEINPITDEPYANEIDQNRRIVSLIARTCPIYQTAGENRANLPCVKEVFLYEQALGMRS